MNQQISDEIKEVKADFEDYMRAQLDLVKLHSAESLSKVFSQLLIKMVLFYLFFFVLLFASIALAIWLETLLANQGLGFIIVAALYLIAGLIFLAMRKKLIEKPVIQSVIQLFFPNYENYEQEN